LSSGRQACRGGPVPGRGEGAGVQPEAQIWAVDVEEPARPDHFQPRGGGGPGQVLDRIGAAIVLPWAERNCFQPSAARRGAGSMPAALRISQMVEGTILCPRPVSSP
jgi:hypothetical protein